MSAHVGTHGSASAWHDAEHGGYAADLPLWDRLASERGGPVLDLGAGTGRVALHLAAAGPRGRRGRLRPRAARPPCATGPRSGGLPVRTIEADVRELDLEEAFPLAIAPMQLLHMLERSRRAAAPR